MLNRTGLVCGIVVTMALGGCPSEEKPEKVVVSNTDAPDTVEPPKAVEPEAPVAVQPTIEREQISIALFNDNELENCVDIKLEITEPGKGLSTKGLTLLLALDALEWMDGKDTLLGMGPDGLAKAFVYNKIDLDAAKAKLKEELANATSKKEIKRLKNVEKGFTEVEEIYAIKWPLLGYEEATKAGSVAKINSCESTQKYSFGDCKLVGKVSNKGSTYSYEVTHHHYSLKTTVDSDKGMKECLLAQGEWITPDKDDPEAARERRHQHSKDLKKKSREFKKLLGR